MNKVLEECALVKLKSLELSLKLAFNLEILFPEIFRDYPDFGYLKNLVRNFGPRNHNWHPSVKHYKFSCLKISHDIIT